MEINTAVVEETPVIAVQGQIDLSNCYKIHDAIDEEIGRGNNYLIVNLDKTSYIDSSCLGVLLGALEKLKRRGGTLVVVGNPLVDRILTLTGLTRIFSFHSSLTDGLDDIKKAKSRS